MGSNYTDEVIIDVITVAKGNSVAEVFDTAEALSASLRADGNIAYARDTQDFYFRSPSGWRAVGGSGVVTYDTEEALIADSPADGNIGFANNTDTFYFRQGGAWEPFAVGGGESNIGGTTGVGAAVYKGKSGITLLFRSMIAGSNKLTVTENADTLSLDVVPANIPHQQLAGAGEKTHAEIDSALSGFSDYVANTPEPIAINDADVSATEVWSSEKVDTELATKLDVSALNDASTSTSDVWSAAKITEELAGIGGGGSIDETNIVHKSGAESISGIKTFTTDTVHGDASTPIGQFFNCGSSESWATQLYQRGGNITTGGLEFLYDTRNWFPWASGPTGGGAAWIVYAGDRFMAAVDSADHSKYALLADPRDQKMSTTCQFQLLNLASDPTGMGPGAIYYNTSTGKLRVYSGTEWVDAAVGGGGSVAAEDLTGTALPAAVVDSSLTSVGTLTDLTVTNPIAGSVSGSAGSVAADSITGTTLASNVVSSSLTSVGTLASLAVTAPIAGSVTGSAASATGNAATATALATPRTINGTAFDGTADITISAGAAAAGTLTGATLASGVTASSLTSVGTLASLAVGAGATVLGGTLAVTGTSSHAGDSSFSGRISLPIGGTASAPTIYFPAASTAGIYADNGFLYVSVGGVQRLGLGTVGATFANNVNAPSFTASISSASTPGYRMSISSMGLYNTLTLLGLSINGAAALTFSTANQNATFYGSIYLFRATSDPTAVQAGQTYFNTTVNKIKVYNGTAWETTADDATVVKLTGNQTIAGTKTFSSPIAGNVTGSAATALGLGASSSDPTGSGAGAEYFNTAIGRPKYYDGSAWQIEGNARVVFDFGDATTPLVLAANAPRTVCQASVTGNIVWALPSAVTAGAGCSFTFVNVGGGGGTATVLTNGSEVIFLASSQTTGGGYVVSANAGETLTVTALVYGNWVATSQTGTWTAH